MTEQGHRLGEVLRSAREAKGVDLPRVERETKIRARYISALERGEYRELPGAVYTRGFLRNYGLYLGLDPEYLIDLYRIETQASAVERPTAPAGPRPIGPRRKRNFVLTPAAIVAAILTVLVGAFIAYLGWEFVNFARTPELRVLDPAGDLARHGAMAYTIRGVTEPDARITIDGLRENPTVTAGADGAFAVEVMLVPGSNVITLVAFDPVTKRDSAEVTRTINVVVDDATPSPGVGLAVDAPAEGATLSGPVGVTGRGSPGATVTITPTLTAPASATLSITDGAGSAVPLPTPGAPAPVSATVGADGAFTASIALPPGTWQLAVAVPDAPEPVTRTVVVAAPAGLAGTLRIEGGESYLEVEEDGAPVADVSGGIAADGSSLPLAAEREIRVLAGNAAAVRLSLNGLDLGAMGDAGAVVEWTIVRGGG